MGYALAEAAVREARCDGRIVSGPVSLATPDKVTRVDVDSAQQMFDAVTDLANSAMFSSVVPPLLITALGHCRPET